MNITRIYYNIFLDVINCNNLRFYLYILNTELKRKPKVNSLYGAHVFKC